jgi:hypothetical protein
MAKAAKDNTPPASVRVMLGDLIELKAVELGSPELGEKWVRRELNDGLQHQYRDARGFLRSGKDLPGGFWLEAAIDRGEHSAKRRARTAPLDPIASYFARFPTLKDFRFPGVTPEPKKPASEYMIPAIEIFCVEVLVPREELPITSAKTTATGIAKLAAPEEAKPTEATTEEKQTSAKTAAPAFAAVEPVEQMPARSTADAADESPPKRSRRRRQQSRPQSQRADKVLRRLYSKSVYGDGWPTREEVSDKDLVARADAEYAQVEGQESPRSRLGPPSPDTYLRVVGRRD